MSAEREAWTLLERELAAWESAGLRATFWWRDDDTVAPSRDLGHLLDLAAAASAPLALAVIPAETEVALASWLDEHPAETQVLQHGWAHRNNAPAGAKKCELVAPALHPVLPENLRRGRRRLEEIFGARFRPVLVPPWNRLDPAWPAQLPGLGFNGLSTSKARATAQPAAGLVQANCHLDVLQWRPTRQFLGTRAALDLLCRHLSARRSGAAERDEPSGLLTHHRVHDAATWDFVAELLARVTIHPAAEWLAAPSVFAPLAQPLTGEQAR